MHPRANPGKALTRTGQSDQFRTFQAATLASNVAAPNE
jgi:hypothetical protein